jgi:hypothetical protein
MDGGTSHWDTQLVPEWAPPPVDTTLPHPHRMYDYLIGGKDHYQVDKAAAEEFVTLAPDSIYTVRAMEAFIPRAVHRLAADGITQFLQLGVAIVSPYNGQAVTDQVARAVQPDSRFLYAAEDHVSVARARALLGGRGPHDVAVVQGEFRTPAALLARREIGSFFDPRRPVGILLICMLDFIADPEQAARALDELYAWAPPGSRIALFHILDRDGVDWTRLSPAVLEGCGAVQMTMRTPQQVREVLAAHLDRFEEPGLVPAPQWHPDGNGPDPEYGDRAALLAGVIAKPAAAST